MNRFSRIYDGQHVYDFYLTFSASGDVGLTRGKPNAVGRDDLVVKLEARLPSALFSRPTLSAVIHVEGNVPSVDIDVQALADQVKATLGLDVAFSVQEPE